eukprot:3818843-Pyramimonas_sp.AAC.1
MPLAPSRPSKLKDRCSGPACHNAWNTLYIGIACAVVGVSVYEARVSSGSVSSSGSRSKPSLGPIHHES